MSDPTSSNEDSQDALHVSVPSTPARNRRQAVDGYFNVQEDSSAPSAAVPGDAQLPRPSSNYFSRRRYHEESERFRKQIIEDERTLQQLRTGETKHSKTSLWGKFCTSVHPSNDGIELERPHEDVLFGVATRAFPPRMSIPVLVCDIRATHAETQCTVLGNIESYWAEKPSDVVVRWIHAPLGNGPLRSSLEDMFLYHGPRGRPFKHAGPPHYPYLSVDVLHFRDKAELQHLRNVHAALKSSRALEHKLTSMILAGNQNEHLAADLDWRMANLRKSMNFWELARADIPSELSEYSFDDDASFKVDEVLSDQLDGSVLSNKASQFFGIHPVVSPFRLFHRADGIVLTMSAATGADLLHPDIQLHMRESQIQRLTNVECSVVAKKMSELEKCGTEHWYQLSTEWFVMHLATELCVGPSFDPGGMPAESITSAMHSAIQDLKRRRYDVWDQERTVALIKEYLVCIDQLKYLREAHRRRVTVLRNLAKDCQEHQEYLELYGSDLPINNKYGDSPSKRIEWAVRICEETKEVLENQLEDMTRSFDTLFQIQTIQQKEFSDMTTDKHNKAIMVVTSVTVVFLPLSFCTSYFGMNFIDIRDTGQTQAYFWKVCFTSTILVVLVVLLCAFQYKYLTRMLNQSRTAVEDAMRLRKRKENSGVRFAV